MNSSYWERTALELEWDAVIVGGGFVGCWAALHLKRKKPHWKIGVVERSAFGAGASTRNAGFACFGSPTELLDDLSQASEAHVWGRVERRWRGLSLWRSAFSEHDLRWEPLGGHELFRIHESDLAQQTQDALPGLNRSMKSITGQGEVFRAMDQLPGKQWHSGFKILGEAQLHPGKALFALQQACQSAGIHLLFGADVAPFDRWEHTTAGWLLPTSRGTVAAERVGMCTNGATSGLFPEWPVVPARGQVVLTHPLPSVPYRGTFHADAGYLYFRNVGDRLLLGGARNHFRAQEQTDDRNTTEEVTGFLEQYLRDVLLPGTSVSVDQSWAGTMAFGPNNEKDPLLAQHAPGLWSAVRLGGMGVALAPVLGEELAVGLMGE